MFFESEAPDNWSGDMSESNNSPPDECPGWSTRGFPTAFGRRGGATFLYLSLSLEEYKRAGRPVVSAFPTIRASRDDFLPRENTAGRITDAVTQYSVEQISGIA